eukprot:s11221_g1.t1
MAIGGEGDFAGKLGLPLPETFSGNPADWEEWAWNFKAYISMFETGAAYISMFETGAVTLMDRAELRAEEFLGEHLQMTLDTGDVDAEQTANRETLPEVLAARSYAKHVREVILEYHRSRLLMNPVAQTSANATFAGGASAPMDIGEELYPSEDTGDWPHFGEDDWSEWTDWAINAVT